MATNGLSLTVHFSTNFARTLIGALVFIALLVVVSVWGIRYLEISSGQGADSSED